MSNINLLPCPCCKGEGRLMQAYGRAFTFYAVICQCGLQTKDMPSMEMAAEIWNKRQPIDDIVAELEKEINKTEEEYWTDHDERQITIGTYYAAIDIVKRGGVNSVG